MSYSPAFHESVDLVLRVYRLMAEGRGETAEANRLRAKSEKPWYEMADEEQDLVNGLSADLYSVGVSREIPGHVVPDAIKSVMAVGREHDYPRTLEIVRELEHSLPSELVAHWRGVCWADMGELAAAIVFFQEARRLDPEEGFHVYMLLRAVAYSHQSVQEADQNLAESVVLESRDPSLLFVAAAVLFSCARRREHKQYQADLYRKVVLGVEKANKLVQGTLIANARQDATVANVWRCLAYDQLDEHEKAIGACRDALELSPYHPVALTIYEKLTGPSNGSKIVEASPTPLFEYAIASGNSFSAAGF